MAVGVQYTVFRSSAETGKGPVLNENVVAVVGTSTQSPTVMDPNGGNKPCSVRLAADTDCFVFWDYGNRDNPVALDTGLGGRAMGPTVSTVEYFDIPADAKIAVIQRTL